MKFCTTCGKEIHDEAVVCVHCGTEVKPTSGASGISKFHKTPKCTYCGNIAPWKVEPVFRIWDWIAAAIFLIPFVYPAAIYLLVVGLIRSKRNNRGKSCTKCGARNLFTFEY